MTHYFRHAGRALKRHALFSGLIVGTLGIGIGTAMIGYALPAALVFTPMVSQDPESFAILVINNLGPGWVTYEQYATLAADANSLREVAAWSRFPVEAPVGASDPTGIRGSFVSCNSFFSVFGIRRPVLGRLLQAEDCDGAAPVTVISERFWMERYASDKSIIGGVLRYGDEILTVVGVAPHPEGFVSEYGLWFPLTLQPTLQSGVSRPISSPGVFEEGTNLLQPNSPQQWLSIGARLAEGHSHRSATAEVRALVDWRELGAPQKRASAEMTDGSRWSSRPNPAEAFLRYLPLPGLVLLMASVNAGALLLSRSLGRQREMAMRLALGARRVHLVLMLFIENLLLVGAAGVLGMWLAQMVAPPVKAVLGLSVPDLLPMSDPHMWPAVVGATIAATLLSILFPALECFNPALAETIKGREKIVAGRWDVRRFRHAVVAVQVAFGLVPVIVGVMFLQAGARLEEPGFEPDNVLLVPLPAAGGADEVRERLSSLPGTVSVAFSQWVPLTSEGTELAIQSPGRAQTVLSNTVSTGYFSTLGIPIVAGQLPSDNDLSWDAPVPSVVVSQTLATALFEEELPLGRVIETSDGSMQIVAVAADRMTRSAGGGSSAAFVYKVMPRPYRGVLFARYTGEGTGYMKTVQGVVSEVTGTRAEVSTLRSVIDQRTGLISRAQNLLLGVGAVALFLAVTGSMAAVSFNAYQRMKEAAIRTALGAGRLTILRVTILRNVWPVLLGAGGGIALTWVFIAALPVAAYLDVRSPVPYVVGFGAMCLADLVALLVPIRQLLSSDPVALLKSE